MQKFIVKKPTRGTIVTIAEEDNNSSDLSDSSKRTCIHENFCDFKKEFSISDSNLGSKFGKNVRMSGYLKKKRNKVGGWTKLYFVLQNSLLLSYSSKEDYEQRLKSFKDVISLIPGNTVILPTLGPRFTLETNLNTFYTFRCDDNKTCSMWISAIMECLAKENDTNNSSKVLRSPKNYYSYENINQKSPFIRQSSLSWEALNTKDSHGKILIGLGNGHSTRFAKLPLQTTTARILERGGLNDYIKRRQIERFEELRIKDENHNHVSKILVHHVDEHLKQLQQQQTQKQQQKQYFRLHDQSETLNYFQSKDVNRINRIFIGNMCDNDEGLQYNMCNKKAESMSNIEEQVQHMSLGEESLLDDSIIDEYLKKSIDPRIFNNGLTIEEFPSIPEQANSEPVYATVNLKSKYEKRLEKEGKIQKETEDFKGTERVYEDIDEKKVENGDVKKDSDSENIYELVELPTRSKNALWRTWKRINFDAFLDFSKRSHESIKRPPEIVPKRQKSSLTFSEFTKRFSSMRNRARKIYRNPLPSFSRGDNVKEEREIHHQKSKSQ